MEKSGQPHTPTALPNGKAHPVPAELEAWSSMVALEETPPPQKKAQNQESKLDSSVVKPQTRSF